METFGETSAVGDWTLYIGSGQGGDLGNVDSWTLHLTTVPEAVPTVSEWGLVVLTLLLLSASTIMLHSRPRPRSSGK